MFNTYDKNKFNWGNISIHRNELFGISIISIIIFHFFEDVVNYTDSGRLYDFASAYNLVLGSIGVEIFLFLSGMGLYFSMRRNGNINIF